jgi:hypothetical protein
LSSLYASVPRLAMSVTRYRLALIAALSALALGARHLAPASTAGPVTDREGARCGLLSVCAAGAGHAPAIPMRSPRLPHPGCAPGRCAARQRLGGGGRAPEQMARACRAWAAPEQFDPSQRSVKGRTMSDMGKSHIVIMWAVGPDDVAAGDRLFDSHGKWMTGHSREGDTALLDYSISKGPSGPTRWIRTRTQPATRSSCLTNSTSHRPAWSDTGGRRWRPGKICRPSWTGPPGPRRLSRCTAEQWWSRPSGNGSSWRQTSPARTAGRIRPR